MKKCDYCGKPIEKQPYVIRGDKAYHLEPCQHELVAQDLWEKREAIIGKRSQFFGKVLSRIRR